MGGLRYAAGIWWKSSYSSGNGQCIEISYKGAVVATRDSKDACGTAVSFERGAWNIFVSHIRAGLPAST
ncbi:DUF397 domain-containing protein [Streptomyces thioluteus]|uniref:DUF397 domain-containing protein n=1 Tax=Streptomyces thioluteus TaxID=66431 RepID=UPI0031EE8B26